MVKNSNGTRPVSPSAQARLEVGGRAPTQQRTSEYRTMARVVQQVNKRKARHLASHLATHLAKHKYM